MNRLDYKHYIIDLSSNNNFVQFNTMQGDGNNVRGFEVELIQNGKNYIVDAEDTLAAIAGTKPDGTEIFNECAVTKEGYILVDVTSQMSAVVGKSDYNLILMSQSNNNQLKSFPFYIIVTPSAFDVSHIVSSDEFQMLTNIVVSATDIAEVTTNEETRQNNEEVRISNEDKRIASEKEREETIKGAETALANANEALSKANDVVEICEEIVSDGVVTGIKGNTETTYRTGKVNITPENIGAAPKDVNLWTGAYEFTGASKGWNIPDTAMGVKYTEIIIFANLSSGITTNVENDDGTTTVKELEPIYLQTLIPFTANDYGFSHCVPVRAGYFHANDEGGYVEFAEKNSQICLSKAYLNGISVIDTVTWKVYCKWYST